MKPPKLTPSPHLSGVTAYQVPRPEGKMDLYLDGNEGAVPPQTLLDALARAGIDCVRRYPSAHSLEEKLANRFGVSASHVIVTAGADEALDRTCRAILAPGREMILPVPTFEMIERYVRLSAGDLVQVPWALGSSYPTKEVLRKIHAKTFLIGVISPNNPTGAVIKAADLEKLSAAALAALIVLDGAYAEFADEDLAALALKLPNVLMLRTFSKAWGLAGLRVGYAIGPEEVIAWLRAAAGPYPVSGPALYLATEWLEEGELMMKIFVERVRAERQELESFLRERGCEVFPSQANFVLARFADALDVQKKIAQLGIALRAFPGKKDLEKCLRITCPGEEQSWERLKQALARVL